jgi:hypothetical protein
MALGALGWLWEFFALQAPSSPWNAPGLPLAVARFAQHAWITGVVIHLLARGVTLPRWVLPGTALGVALTLGAQAASALTGLMGIQIRDVRAGAGIVLAARALGGAALVVSFIAAAGHRLRRVS